MVCICLEIIKDKYGTSFLGIFNFIDEASDYNNLNSQIGKVKEKGQLGAWMWLCLQVEARNALSCVERPPGVPSPWKDFQCRGTFVVVLPQ